MRILCIKREKNIQRTGLWEVVGKERIGQVNKLDKFPETVQKSEYGSGFSCLSVTTYKTKNAN